jgi:hypothetical protein
MELFEVLYSLLQLAWVAPANRAIRVAFFQPHKQLVDLTQRFSLQRRGLAEAERHRFCSDSTDVTLPPVAIASTTSR